MLMVNMKRIGLAAALATALVLSVTQTVGAVQLVKHEGTGSIMPTWNADLDEGIFNGGFATVNDDDIHFDIGTKRYIEPDNGVLLLRMGSKPSYSTCASAALVSKLYPVGKSIGHWFCIYTESQRFGRFHVDSAPAGGNLTLTYRIWCKANNHC